MSGAFEAYGEAGIKCSLVHQHVGRLEYRVGKEPEVKEVIRDLSFGVGIACVHELGLLKVIVWAKVFFPLSLCGEVEVLSFHVVILFSFPIGVIQFKIQASSVCSGTLSRDRTIHCV